MQRIGDVPRSAYDRMIVASRHAGEDGVERLVALGVPLERMIILPLPGMSHDPPESIVGTGTDIPPLMPVVSTPTSQSV